MKKILIVANLNSLLEKGKSILSRSDFMIFTTHSGNEAIEIHKKEQADLIIADLETKDMAGDMLCSLIRSQETLKKVSFVMLCRKRQEDLDRIEECKANAVITKPLLPEDLLSKVGRLLDVPERKSFRVLIKITVEGKFLNEPFFCSSRDISASGILIETEKPLEKGDTISCSFFLPGSRRILAQGQVMRSLRSSGDMHHYGVRFLHILPEDLSALEKFITTKLQEE